MLDLLALQKSFILSHIQRGDVVCDFTMGNGNDTLFLSQSVGDEGKVYAFDIQELALQSTKKHLVENNAPENYTLILDSHDQAPKYIKEKIKAGMFNLGYLPGSGHKEITTLRKTTMPAVTNALEMLDSNGILLIAVYPGHEEGTLEGQMLEEYFETLNRKEIGVTKIKIINSPTSPFFFVCEKK